MTSEKSTGVVKRSMSQPDETRRPEKALIEITKLGDIPMARTSFEPGWKWSTHMKPIVKTDSCELNHTFYVISGRMHVKMDDGTEHEFSAGDSGIVPPGHDAWVIGDEKFVAVDVTGAKS